MLEQERLGFGVGYRHLDLRNLGDERRGLRLVDALLEVGRNALFQVARLADVDDLVLRIEHAVDARAVRQRLAECR